MKPKGKTPKTAFQPLDCITCNFYHCEQQSNPHGTTNSNSGPWTVLQNEKPSDDKMKRDGSLILSQSHCRKGD